MKGRFVRATHALLGALHIHKRSLDIFLLSSRDMVHLKQRSFLHAPKKTQAKIYARGTPVDVLSFPAPKNFPDPERAYVSIGEVYVNYDILSRDQKRGTMLLMHGVLHILGYDHERERDAARMERLEHTLWDRIVSSD